MINESPLRDCFYGGGGDVVDEDSNVDDGKSD